ncbi:MAG: hypothetical protein IPN93_00100 [Bacteroidetes bacterium]|nr:hypothetical protein [Bacteroidota bacterium]
MLTQQPINLLTKQRFTNQYGLSVNQAIFLDCFKLKTIEKGKLDYKAIKKLDSKTLLTNIQLNVDNSIFKYFKCGRADS